MLPVFARSRHISWHPVSIAALSLVAILLLGIGLAHAGPGLAPPGAASGPHAIYLPAVQSAPRSTPAEPPGLPPRRWDPRLDQRGTVLQPAQVQPGQGYWRLVEAAWLDEEESQGRGHILVDLVDERGKRVVGAPVRFWWRDDGETKLTQEKPGEPFAVDFPMAAVAPAYGAAPADANPADRVWGMGLGSIEQPYFAILTSYRLVWQWTVVPGSPTATPTPTWTPTPPPSPTPTPSPATPTPEATESPTPTPTPTATPTPSSTSPNLPPRRWDPRLDQRGTVLQPAQVQPGQGYWRLVEAAWLDEEESEGRHHILVDILDSQGRRMVGVPVRFWWNGGEDIQPTQAKPGEPFAVDFAMYAVAPAYGAAPADGSPADRVWGMGLGSIEQPYFTIHTSYRLVWQWTVASGGSPPTPTPPPGATPTPTPTPAITTPTPTATPPPTSTYLFSRARLVRCDPNGGTTYVHGTLRLNGQPVNGYRVVFSYQPDGPIVAGIQSGPHEGYWGWADGYYSHILQAGGPRAGDWWFWVVDDQGQRISALGYVRTDGYVDANSCQQALLDFEG